MTTSEGAVSRGVSSWDRRLELLSQPRSLRGASVFRIVGGVAILLELLLNYAQRAYLFGPDAVYPFDAYAARLNGFPIYALSRSPLYFEVVYHIGIAVALAWTLGVHTRYLTPLTLVFWRGLHERNPMLWDGGDNLMSLLLIYACFAQVSEHWSYDSVRRSAAREEAGARPSRWRAVANVVHNGALLAFALQVCLVYGIAGLTKVQGEVWRNGTALYFAFIDPEHSWPLVTPFLWKNGVVLTLLSYFTVAFQVGFSFLLFLNPWSRRCVVFIAVGFHIGIALCMGLVTFGLFMMAADLALIEDRDYEALARWARRSWSRVRALRGDRASLSVPAAN